MDSAYEKLAQALDQLPQGFPRTASGVEVRLLKMMFTPEESQLACFLTDSWDSAEAAATKANLPPHRVRRLLQVMSLKGLVLRYLSEETELYCLNHFIVGSYETTMFRLEGEAAHQFSHLFEDYIAETRGLTGIMEPNPAIHRVVPVGGAIKREWILPYDDVKAFLEGAQSFSLIDCVCRKQREFVSEQECAFPKKTCLSFSLAKRPANAHSISREEALAFLEDVERIGLVHTVSNVGKGISYVCNCCGCCCGILRSINEYGVRESVAQANYYAIVDQDGCIGCGVCVKRCQVDAIRLSDGLASVNLERCIGCGLCITSCPTDTVELLLKQADEILAPPADAGEWSRLRKIDRNLEP